MHVVAVHGYLLDRRLWLPLAAELGRLAPAATFLALDLRGRGTSTRPAVASHPMSLLADDLAEEIDVSLPEDEPFVLAGLSMGGYVAFEFLRRHGSRFRSRLAGLALCDTRANPDDAAGKAGRSAAAEAIREHGMDAPLATMLPRLISRSSFGTAAEETARAMILETPPDTARADLFGMMERQDGFGPLGAFDRPVLVVVGDDDQLTTPADAEALVEGAQNAPFVKLHTVPGAGHLAPLEAPEDVAAAFAELLVRAGA
jgi:pimeloyl-ACP methyl ester carboxylesterase